MSLFLQKVARSSFSLLVRVVDGLADCDFDDPTVTELLTQFMAELVADGELNLAQALRSKFIQECGMNLERSALASLSLR